MLGRSALGAARVVVERLDSLGARRVSSDNVVCPVVDDDIGRQPIFAVSVSGDYQPEPLSESLPETAFALAEPTVEEKKQGLASLGAAVGVEIPEISLNTNITFDMEPLLDTPTAETILDDFLADSDYSMENIEPVDNTKWTDGLDDLFPELD